MRARVLLPLFLVLCLALVGMNVSTAIWNPFAGSDGVSLTKTFKKS